MKLISNLKGQLSHRKQTNNKKGTKSSIKIPDCCIEHTPTKSKKGGALLHIPKKLNYKNKQDLNINKDEKLKSVFIEVLSKSNKNTIIGFIYKHPKLTLAYLTQNFHSTPFR